MKKYFFFIAVSAALFLSGCERDRTATVIYTDVPSPLTRMTFETTLPPETYSQYMETYTPSSETDPEENRHYFSRPNDGVRADTRASFSAGGGVGTVTMDTAVTAAPESSSDTDALSSSAPSETEETVTCFTEASVTTDGLASSGSNEKSVPERPVTDTAYHGSIFTDTALKRPETAKTSSESSESETTE